MADKYEVVHNLSICHMTCVIMHAQKRLCCYTFSCRQRFLYSSFYIQSCIVGP